MKSTVILCTRNRLKEAIRFSKSLYSQSRLPEEYIIVDSSTDKLLDKAEFNDEVLNILPKIDKKYIHSGPGLPYQRNIGISNATKEIIYFFDDDVILEPTYLEEMNKIYDSEPQYGGGMGAFIKIGKPGFLKKVNLALRTFFMLQRDFGDGKFRPSGFPQHAFGVEEFLEVEAVGGACFSFRKAVVDEFRFDEKMKAYASQEDVDYSKRVSEKYKLFYNPKALCEHRHAYGGRGNLVGNRKMYIFNFRYLFFKNFYNKRQGSLIAHWWAILGLIVMSLSIRKAYGYILGLIEFRRMKKELYK